MCLRNFFQTKLEDAAARGIIVVDKESGITSHDEVNRLRTIFNTRKVGHSGTLDPQVTGVLVCGLGKGTKLLEYILLEKKVYISEVIFHAPVSREEFTRVLEEYQGIISQLPPRKSRVKRVSREREVYNLELLKFDHAKKRAWIRASVERGTYIRKLCHDMGVSLGVGAQMGKLRRVQAGMFTLENTRAVDTFSLEKWAGLSQMPYFGWLYYIRIMWYVYPIERVLRDMPWVEVEDTLAQVITSGAHVYIPGVLDSTCFKQGEMVWVCDTQGKALAIGKAGVDSHEITSLKRGVAVYIQKVLCS